MSFVVVGTNHRHSAIKVRERIAFSKKRMKDGLDFLMRDKAFESGAILSTCNRVEVYAGAKDPDAAINEIEHFISRYHEVDKGKLVPCLYAYKDKEALKHLFSVACGLDSLIVGETQILGQVRSSFLESKSAGFTDNMLEKAFRSAINFSRRMYRETGISEGKVSVGSVAIDFIKDRIGSLSGKNVLIIGAGKVTELVLRYLEKEKPDVTFISNRTHEKAKELAGRIGAQSVKFDHLDRSLKNADVIITATASPHFVIKKETLDGAVNRKLIIIDLALPRDVDPKVREIRNVELFFLEDLDTVIRKNMKKKSGEAVKVKNIIDLEVDGSWEEITGSELEEALSP